MSMFMLKIQASERQEVKQSPTTSMFNHTLLSIAC